MSSCNGSDDYIPQFASEKQRNQLLVEQGVYLITELMDSTNISEHLHFQKFMTENDTGIGQEEVTYSEAISQLMNEFRETDEDFEEPYQMNGTFAFETNEKNELFSRNTMRAQINLDQQNTLKGDEINI